MRHLKRTAKLGRTSASRNALLASMVCSLIKHQRIQTTLAKAKAVRSVAEKIVTLGKRGHIAASAATTEADDKKKAALSAENVHCRRLVAAKLRFQAKRQFKGTKKRPGKVVRENWRENEDVVHILFDKIAPVFKERKGGYTRIVKLGQRRGDVAQMAILEFVDRPTETAPAPVAAEGDKK